jgi:D-3-phosphoglycerate dehydrogenase
VLVTPRSFAQGDDEPLRLLEKAGCEVRRIEMEEMPNLLAGADGVIAGLEPYPADLLAKAAPSGGGKLRVVSRYGVGYDAVDIAAAQKAGVTVAYTPGANSDSVADLTIALMLAAARHVHHMDARLRAKDQQRPQGLEVWQKTVGVIGAGRIGKGVIRRLFGFGCRFLCYDTFHDDAFMAQYNGTYTDLDTLYAQSDFITVHSPLNDETRGMVGKAAFAKMKKTAIIVNTARGGIIDEAALYAALKEGRIAGAGLDATVEEPPYHSPLLELPNCVFTPHAGAATAEAQHNMGMMAAQNLLDILQTGKCKYLV